MNNKNFDKKLVKKSYELISKKYSTENGKKFILHLVSSFIINNPEDITIENSGKIETLECCISRCRISPINTPAPTNTGECYHGLMSNKSNKVLSMEAYEALNRFISYRLKSDDDIISRIKSYMDKNKKEHKKSYIPKNKIIKESKATYEDTEVLPNPDL